MVLFSSLLACLAHAVGLAVGDDDVAVVEEPVEEADGGGVFGQEPAPGFEGSVGADSEAAAFVGGGDESEQELGGDVVERREPELVADDQIVSEQRVDDLADAVVGEAGSDPAGLVPPHTHSREDEFSLVLHGRLGSRVGDRDLIVEEGAFLFQARQVLHALWNPTDIDLVLLVFITPPGFEDFFREMGALGDARTPAALHDLNVRFGHIPHPELIPEISRRHHVSL